MKRLNITKPFGCYSETINRALIYHAANKYMPKFTLNFASNALEVNYYQKCLDSLVEIRLISNLPTNNHRPL